MGLKSGIRRLLPGGIVRGLETAYRLTRVYIVSAWFGFPARDLRVIAVTGTNGKTTTASFINEILKEAGLTTALFSTAVIDIAGEQKINDLNATVTTTAKMQRFFRQAKRVRADYVIIEATSHALEQHKLDTVPIEVAVMTNLTQDHLDYHRTMAGYAAAKGILFQKKPRFIVLNKDDEWFDYFDKFEADSQKITYGTSDEAEARIDHVTLFKKGSEARLVIDHQTKLDLATALPGKFNVYNLAAAAATAYILGVKRSDIVEGVANLDGVPGRFERVDVGKAYDVIVDYAHTPDALEKLLEAVKSITKNRVILVFGSCGDRDKGKRPIMGEIAAKMADRIILTDEESYNEDPDQIRRMIYEGIETAHGTGKTTEVADRKEAIDKALGLAVKGDTVLITGMGHEKFRIVGGKRLPWNDAEVVRELTVDAKKS